MSNRTAAFFITTIFLPLLLTEFGDWCPSLAKRLVRWTARRLGDTQTTERYSEEWIAELEHLPGKLSHLLTAMSYLLALPRIRWSLRAARRCNTTGPDLEQLLPQVPPLFWNPRGAFLSWAYQANACSELLGAILNENPRVRNRLHFLVGPLGCGKGGSVHWLHERLSQAGKKVHYVWAPAWANEMHPLHVSVQLRDQLAQASQKLSLLIVDEADLATVEVLKALRLPCPVLIIGGWKLGELKPFPPNAGVIVDMWNPLDLRSLW